MNLGLTQFVTTHLSLLPPLPELTKNPFACFKGELPTDCFELNGQSIEVLQSGFFCPRLFQPVLAIQSALIENSIFATGVMIGGLSLVTLGFTGYRWGWFGSRKPYTDSERFYINLDQAHNETELEIGFKNFLDQTKNPQKLLKDVLEKEEDWSWPIWKRYGFVEFVVRYLFEHRDTTDSSKFILDWVLTALCSNRYPSLNTHFIDVLYCHPDFFKQMATLILLGNDFNSEDSQPVKRMILDRLSEEFEMDRFFTIEDYKLWFDLLWQFCRKTNESLCDQAFSILNTLLIHQGIHLGFESVFKMLDATRFFSEPFLSQPDFIKMRFWVLTWIRENHESFFGDEKSKIAFFERVERWFFHLKDDREIRLLTDSLALSGDQGRSILFSLKRDLEKRRPGQSKKIQDSETSDAWIYFHHEKAIDESLGWLQFVQSKTE